MNKKIGKYDTIFGQMLTKSSTAIEIKNICLQQKEKNFWLFQYGPENGYSR